MSATDHLYFSAKVSHYKASYDRDGDDIRYVTNVTVAAVNLWLAEQKKMGKAGLVLPTALSAGSPFLMATMDAVADQVHCPVNKRMSALEFLKHLNERIKIRYDSEYIKPTKEALKSVHDALQSLGLLALPKCQHCHKGVAESGLIAHKCCGKKFCDNCSQGMRTRAPGNRFMLNCVCGKSRMIDMQFPPSYRRFLAGFGAALCSGFEIAGLFRHVDDEEPPLWSDVVLKTSQLRRRAGDLIPEEKGSSKFIFTIFFVLPRGKVRQK